MHRFGNVAHFPTTVSIPDLTALGQDVRITAEPTRKAEGGMSVVVR